MKNSERNYGIDLLRIVAVIMIVILHCFTQGGLLNNSISMSKQDCFNVFIVALVYAGVDIFALISGFVSYRKNLRVDYSRYIELWITVVFYSVLICLILCSILPEYRFKDNILYMIMPVSTNVYWYFTAFTGLYIIKPLINKGLESCTDNVLKCLFVLILFLYSVYSTFFDVFGLQRGYSVIWIVLLYTLGYIVNRCKIFQRYNSVMLILLLVLLVCITVISNYTIKTYESMLVSFDRDVFLSYISPTILLISIIMVVLFSRIQINEKIGKYVMIVSATSFSVYLVNCHPIFFQAILKDMFIDYCNKPIIVILISVLLFSIPFVLIVVLFDLLRARLFKLCMVDKVTKKIELVLRKIVKGLVKVL